MNILTWKTKLHSVTRDGVTWQCWDQWELNLQFCGFGRESDWYDGPYDFWKFGIGLIVRYGHCNYREAHEAAGK